MSDAFLKISQGFAEVATVMSSNLETSMPAPSLTINESSSLTSSESVTPKNISNYNIGSGSEVSTGSQGSQVKKVKKLKDPNAPKRPLNAYMLFQNDYRKHLKATYPDMPPTEVVRAISDAWIKLSPEEKGKYEEKFKNSSILYNEEFKQYKEKSSHPIQSTESHSLSSEHESSADDSHKTESAETETPKKKKKKQKHEESSRKDKDST